MLSDEETYAVCLKEDNKAIGSIGLMIGRNSNLDIPENEGEIGYWIGVPFWGQGLIPEAVRELIRYAFDDLHLARLFERMKQDHEAKEFTVNSSPYAVPIYRKLGFCDTDKEQTADGLVFTPMKCTEQK